MSYNEELKNKKTWILVIEPHRYDEKDNKPTRKMIKFNMPIPPPVINGRKVKNNADDARLVWDELFAWKYGKRAMDINFMMNIQDINRAIHVKVNFVSLIEKPPKQLKKEGLLINTPVITPDKKKMEILRQNELKDLQLVSNPIIPIGDSISDDTEAMRDIYEGKLPRIKPGQRFMEDMTDKHLDPDVRKVVRVEERLTDDRFHMLRSKYVRMFDKKSLDKVIDVDAVKNYWWCKTYLWRQNGKGVINMGYAIYSTEELYSFERLTDERTIALKMEVMQWNKRISNEI
jgi:hypothetical protein